MLCRGDCADATDALALAKEGEALVGRGCVYSGIRLFARVLQQHPHAVGVLHHLANALLSVGAADEALEAARRAHEADPSHPAVQSNLLSVMMYAPSLRAEDVARAHRQWGSQFPVTAGPSRRVGDRVRIGYLSSCFRQNPEFFFIEPVLRSHDRTKFEVFCYSSTAIPDNFTARIRDLSDGWRDMTGLSDEQAAQVIREDGVDILADCSGHFADSRLRVLAHRPAPVQISLPTYPVTTGLGCVDYRITDLWSDPPGNTEHLYSEQLMRLPGAFVCWSPWADASDVGPLPAERNGFVTFGSFNRLDKINGAVVSAWAQILRRAPGSRLLVNATFHGHADPPREHCDVLLRRFAELGIPAERIDFLGALPLREYLDVRNRVDVALDCFPFRGLTTSCDSLWMGVPLVTLTGVSHLERTGLSLLASLDLQEWAAASIEQYIEVAADAAQDLPRLRAVRGTLRSRMRESTLTDVAGYTRNLEAAFMDMIRRSCS